MHEKVLTVVVVSSTNFNSNLLDFKFPRRTLSCKEEIDYVVTSFFALPDVYFHRIIPNS